MGDKNGEPLGSSILGSNAILLFWYIARVICWKQKGIHVSFYKKWNYLVQFLTKQKTDKAIEPFSILHTPQTSFVILPLGNSTSQFQTPVKKKWRHLSICIYTQWRFFKIIFRPFIRQVNLLCEWKTPPVFKSTCLLCFYYNCSIHSEKMARHKLSLWSKSSFNLFITLVILSLN